MCKGGEKSGMCLSCRLKNVWNATTGDKRFKINEYVHRSIWNGMNVLVLVKDHFGVPKYNDAQWIIQVLLCDYLDNFGNLGLVQPPVDYIRNPACVQRDAYKESQKKIVSENRDIRLRLCITNAVRNACHTRFAFSNRGMSYVSFLPDWYGGYLASRLEAWPDDEMPVETLEKEANRLINVALEKDPSLASLETVGAVMGVSDTGDDTTYEDWSNHFARHPDLFNNK